MVNISLLWRVQLNSALMDLLGQFVTLDGMMQMQLHSVKDTRGEITVSSCNVLLQKKAQCLYVVS